MLYSSSINADRISNEIINSHWATCTRYANIKVTLKWNVEAGEKSRASLGYMINSKRVRVIQLFALLPSLHHMTRRPSNSIKTLTFSILASIRLPNTLFYDIVLWILWLKQVGFLDNTPIFKLKWQNCLFYSAPCMGIFSRFDFSIPCNFYIRKSCGTTNIPLNQENCGACSLL